MPRNPKKKKGPVGRPKKVINNPPTKPQPLPEADPPEPLPGAPPPPPPVQEIDLPPPPVQEIDLPPPRAQVIGPPSPPTQAVHAPPPQTVQPRNGTYAQAVERRPRRRAQPQHRPQAYVPPPPHRPQAPERPPPHRPQVAQPPLPRLPPPPPPTPQYAQQFGQFAATIAGSTETPYLQLLHLETQVQQLQVGLNQTSAFLLDANRRFQQESDRVRSLEAQNAQSNGRAANRRMADRLRERGGVPAQQGAPRSRGRRRGLAQNASTPRDDQALLWHRGGQRQWAQPHGSANMWPSSLPPQSPQPWPQSPWQWPQLWAQVPPPQPAIPQWTQVPPSQPAIPQWTQGPQHYLPLQWSQGFQYPM